MIVLNVVAILEKQGHTKYWLFNKLNELRSAKGTGLLSYTNFRNLVEQKNQSIKYSDIDDLCDALDCSISDLLTKLDDKTSR